mmetsp:Transcript_1538/g.4445  ORF Transcript_1538/g.4445 Transcript_1538/m.4445 type:complete len:394 (+) Transcript_1538:507-1688(+)
MKGSPLRQARLPTRAGGRLKHSTTPMAADPSASSERQRQPGLVYIVGAAAVTLLAVVCLSLLPDRTFAGAPLLIPSSPKLASRECIQSFIVGQWRVHTPSSFRHCSGPLHEPQYATCGSPDPHNSAHWQWDRQPFATCGAHYLSREAVHALLGGQWVAVAGDSVTRFAFGALLRLLSSDSSQQMVFGHQDFEYSLPCGIRASFHWTPYANNITRLVRRWVSAGVSPDVLLTGTALWHMLHMGAFQDYGARVGRLAKALKSLAHVKRSHPPQMFWLTVTRVVPDKLNTEEKRQQMTLENIHLYNEEIQKSGIQDVPGLNIIDMHHLTASCGASCTEDGIHYSNSTYDIVSQVFLNMIHYLHCSASAPTAAESQRCPPAGSLPLSCSPASQQLPV